LSTSDELLKAILATVARATFPAEELYKIVAPTAGSQRQLLAYNLCDGETPQATIGKKTQLDAGNLSRAITRWVEAGVVVRIGPDRYPLHVYPLIEGSYKPAQEK
jgi:DNA-binding MarR family transcriptional regulator